MQIALVDDQPDRHRAFSNALSALAGQFPHLTMLDVFPHPKDDCFTAYPTEKYIEVLGAIRDLEGGAILLLDLDLGVPLKFLDCEPAIRERAGALDQIPTCFRGEGSAWQGLLIGRELIANSRIRPLVLYIASGKGVRSRENRKWLEKAVAESNDSRVVIEDFGDAIDETEKASLCISEALSAFGRLNDALSSLWSETALWFCRKNPADELTRSSVPHSLPEEDRAELWGSYRQAFESVFDINLPQEVWKKYKSVEMLHESLKTLVGWTYCGNKRETIDASDTLKTNLSCGAVYLLLLLAEKQVTRDANLRKFNRLVKSFDAYTCFPNRLLARQSPEDAQSAARAIHSLFCLLLRPEAKYDNAVIEHVQIGEAGRSLYIVLSQNFQWRKVVECASSIMSDPSGHLALPATGEAPLNLGGCLGSLWRAQIIALEGFGAPGSIWMQKNVLRFHSGEL